MMPQKRESVLDKNDLLSNYLFPPSAFWNWTADKCSKGYFGVLQKRVSQGYVTFQWSRGSSVFCTVSVILTFLSLSLLTPHCFPHLPLWPLSPCTCIQSLLLPFPCSVPSCCSYPRLSAPQANSIPPEMPQLLSFLLQPCSWFPCLPHGKYPEKRGKRISMLSSLDRSLCSPVSTYSCPSPASHDCRGYSDKPGRKTVLLVQ